MGLITWTILGTIVILIVQTVIKYLRTYIQLRRTLGKMPAPNVSCHFLLGHLIHSFVPLNQLGELVTNIVNVSPPLFVVWFGPMPIVVLIEPKHVEPILGNINYIDKPFIYSFLRPWLGTGLLTSTGSKWHSRRKMLTPAFHFAILENFVEVFAKQSEILVKKLQKNIGSQSFDVYPYITTCALDIICETAMGVEIKAQDQEKPDEYVEAVQKSTIAIMERGIAPWLYPTSFFNISPTGRKFRKHVNTLHSFSNKVIRERKQLYARVKKGEHESEDLHFGKKKKMSFLDLLLETSNNGENLTDEDIREEVDTFMFEGHDTTTAAISWTLCLLANHPDIQDKAYEEIESMFQGSDRPPTMKDLNEMKYLERVIKEALRLFPSVPIILRYHKEDIVVDGYTIPSNTIIALPIFFTHRLKEHYPDPEIFNPDNFLPERVAARHPYAYIPFSAGPRNCIGQKFALLEEKTVLSYILRNYKLETTCVPVHVPELILRPDNGVHIKITPRSSLLK